MIKDYYSITKPGIIAGNIVTIVAGFALASRGHIDWRLLLMTLIGVSLVIASGCVFNNYIDRDIDKIMERTKNRVLALGRISLLGALLYGFVLGLLGIGILFFTTNILTSIVAFAGLFVYVVLYTLGFKRRSVWGTLVGSISGAVPPVLGYLAVSNTIDIGAIVLFLILTLWQMPHSFAIAIYRLKDYARAGIPVLPVKKGINVAKIFSLVSSILFVLASSMLAVLGYTGGLYFLVMLLFGGAWVGLGVRGFWVTDNRVWARQMFIFSIVTITIFSFMVIVDSMR